MNEDDINVLEEVVEPQNNESVEVTDYELVTNDEVETDKAQGGEAESNGENQSEDGTIKQDQETNARYAEARRKAEAQVKARDAEYARRFYNVTNPITGMPIRSEKDYFDALDAQEQLEAMQELENKGIDSSVLDQAISNHPLIKQAKELVQSNTEALAQKQIEDDVALISKLDPSIKSLEDIFKLDNIGAILDRCNNGFNLVEAFKLENFDKLTSIQAKGARQQAINQIRSKDHMRIDNAIGSNDNNIDMPSEVLKEWKAFYPELSENELRKKYAKLN